MSQYAGLLAAQGSLAAALSYLPTDANQMTILHLRDRLFRAQGEQVAGQESAPSSYVKYQGLKGGAGSGHSLSQGQPQPTGLTQQYYPQGEAPPPPGFAPQVIPNPVGQVQALNSTSTAYNAYSPIGSRQMLPPTHQPQQHPHGAGGPAYYQPHQHSAPSAPSAYFPPAPSHSLPSAVAPRFPGQPQVSSPASNPTSAFPTLSGASYQHGGPGAPAPSAACPPSTGPPGPQDGWNDPPALSRMPKKKQMFSGNFTPPAPITAPIMNPVADPQTSMQSQQSSFQTSQQLGAQNPYPGMLQPTMVPKHSTEEAPGAPTGDIMLPVQPITTEKIAKKPIPEEHAILKITFEGLIQRCMNAATDPQTKRKLDDANKRLESLYDKLRDQVLSPVIIGGLHSIARSIESQNYTEGLSIHTHIVSTSNFSEISAFMPILKVVLTQANKLGV